MPWSASCGHSMRSWRLSRPSATSTACCTRSATPSASWASSEARSCFWGTADAVTTGEDQLGRVRERVTAFESRVGELEAHRQSTREQIDKNSIVRD